MCGLQVRATVAVGGGSYRGVERRAKRRMGQRKTVGCEYTGDAKIDSVQITSTMDIAATRRTSLWRRPDRLAASVGTHRLRR